MSASQWALPITQIAVIVVIVSNILVWRAISRTMDVMNRTITTMNQTINGLVKENFEGLMKRTYSALDKNTKTPLV